MYYNEIVDKFVNIYVCVLVNKVEGCLFKKLYLVMLFMVYIFCLNVKKYLNIE